MCVIERDQSRIKTTMESLDQTLTPQTVRDAGIDSAVGPEKDCLIEKTSSTTLKNRLSRLRSNSLKSATSRKSQRTYVEHDYEDHYFDSPLDPIEQETEQDEGTRRGPRGGVVEPFPSRLFRMLEDAEANEFDDLVSWQPHGRCFIVHCPTAFVEKIMPK
jgi:hypothetical protein